MHSKVVQFISSLYFLLPLIPLVTVPEVDAATTTVICKNKTNGSLVLRANHCKSSETKISNISQLTGATGAAGADGSNGVNGTNGTNGVNGNDGADGSLRIYGDASAGELHVTSSAAFSSGGNKQYSNIIIDLGVTLLVESGTVLRATGTFTNNGTIVVSSYAPGSFINSNLANSGTFPAISIGSPGVATVVGAQGAYGPSSATLSGAVVGLAMSSETAQNQLVLGPPGGSGGGAGDYSSNGGAGGGTLTILSAGAVVNNGTINADGDVGGLGSGGGGGGIVILASKTSVTNSATGVVTARGGSAGNSSTSSGAGGGGGGGIIHLISPLAPVNSGTFTLSGGTAGSNATSVTLSPRTGGGGGGSCGGAGGSGSSVSTGNVSSGATAGDVGQSFITTADPTSLF